MIFPVGKQPEWFRFTQRDPVFHRLLGKPGLRAEDPNGASWKCHRNVLRLADELPEVAKILALPQADSHTWAARDEFAEAHGFKYRTTQHQALDFIGPRRAALIGDDMRLGKTLSAIASHDPARGQFVVVAPLSARGVWLGWIRRVFPGYSDRIGVLSTRKFDGAKVREPFVFIHYDLLAYWESIRPIGTLVFDEAHLLGNPRTKRAIAASLLATNAQKIIALTGTPIWDMPPDLWMLLSLLNRGGAWGDYYSFCNRYGAPQATPHGTIYTGLSNGDELKHRLSEVMLRRRWIDVSDDVPPITRSVIVSEVSDTQRKRLDILAAKLQSERTNTAGNLAAYRRQVTMIKLATVEKKAREVMDRGAPIIIWTWHKDNANAIAERLNDGRQQDLQVASKAFIVHGDISADERERRIDAWKASHATALIITMSVGQVAINLVHPDTLAPNKQPCIALYAEIDYTPAVIGQSEMRGFDPARGMDIIFIIANHFVDQRIVRALINKLSAADPLGVAAANDAIDALRDAVLGPQQEGDLDRLLEDLLAS